MAITAQESWTNREGKRRVQVPEYIREIVEEVAFQAREDKRVDKRSGVSQRLPISTLENVLSSAEQRAVRSHESAVVARVADVYAAIPSMTGKFELEYEGEMRGAENIARELIRAAVGKTFTKYFKDVNFQPVVQWFEIGGELKVPANAASGELLASSRRFRGYSSTWKRWGFARRTTQRSSPPRRSLSLKGFGRTSASTAAKSEGYFAEDAEDTRAARTARAFRPHAAAPVQLSDG